MMMLTLQPVGLPVPFLPPPVMPVYNSSTTLPSATVPVISTTEAANTGPSSGQSTKKDKTDTEELPLWVETKTDEGKVSLALSF